MTELGDFWNSMLHNITDFTRRKFQGSFAASTDVHGLTQSGHSFTLHLYMFSILHIELRVQAVQGTSVAPVVRQRQLLGQATNSQQSPSNLPHSLPR